MNKMFKKILAVVAVMSTAACLSISAFAADVTVAPTDTKVSVTPTAVDNATQYTVMVFNTTADITDAEAVAAATPADVSAIYYINQGSDVTALVTDMLVKATTVTNADETTTTTYLPEGNYIVRVGNDTGSVQNFALECKETEIKLWGDVDGNKAVDATDADWILRRVVNSSLALANEAVADVDGNKSIDATDADWILRRVVNSSLKFPVEE